MDLPALPSASNLAFVEDLYYAWLGDPGVGRRALASLLRRPSRARPGAAPAPAAFPPRRAGAAEPVPQQRQPDAAFQARVDALAEPTASFGHLRARLDPLGLIQPAEPFALAAFGLSERTWTARPPTRGARRPDPARPAWPGWRRPTAAPSASSWATSTTRTCARWLEQRMERTRNRLTLAPEVRKQLYGKILEAEMLEQFLGTRFLGAKRFSAEGAEGLPGAARVPARPGDRPRRPQRGHRHGPPRPAQRAGQHRRQAAPEHLRASSATPRIVNAGRRRREVPPRLLGRPRHPRRRARPRLARLQPQPPGVDRHRGAGAGPRQAGPLPRLRAAADHAGADPRRRRLRRAGDRGRGAQHVGAGGLPRGRHHPRDRQQPGRLHHLAHATPAPPPTAPAWPACSRSPSST